jgi:serine/threonine-protein kinase ULK/ATG1
MEYCDLGDLKSFINVRSPKKQLLSEQESRHVLKDVVMGLAHLTNVCHVMHRDIKLDNILVQSKRKNVPRDLVDNGQMPITDYEFKLGDLGLAKAHVDESNMAGTMCGTPLCMAPEVILGERYNYKADVWSLGALLFQMLTGLYPFVGRNLEDLKINIRKG